MKEQLNSEDRKGLIAYRLKRASETIAEAEYNAKGGYYNTAVNRLYYSAYYATSALMLAYGLKTSTHAGVKTLLSLHFVRTGLLDIEHGKTFMLLFENRQSGDYEDFVYCDSKLYSQLLPMTLCFIEAIRELLISLPDFEK